MSVVNPSLIAPSRRISLTVRLSPYLVETLCELTRAVRDKTHAQTEIAGLLFGTAGEEMTTVEALRSFEDTGPRSDLARRERLDKSFDNAMAQADEDPELAACRLVGWFSLRSSSGLLSSDIEFHNRHFKQAEDLALVVWREADTQVIAELYARIENRMLSGSDYRWSSVRLSTELRRVSEPIDLAMRAKVPADSYLRAYQNTEDDEKRHGLKKIASSVKRTARTALALIPKLPKRERKREKDYSLTAAEPPRSYGRQLTDTAALLRRDEKYSEQVARLEPSRAPAPYRAVRYPEGELSGLPMVIKTPPKRPAGLPWLSTALVFIAFSAITFAVLAVKGSEGGNGKLAQIIRVIFPSGDLGLHVESQGDRLLLSWNRRNTAVASASDGVLQIFDGATHREVKLNGEQVADGSVLYKPLTQDVTFRLEVRAAGQPPATGSMRVLDATSASHEAPVLDVKSSSVAPASVTPASATPPPSATQARTPPPQQPVNPMPVPDTARAATEKTPPPVTAPPPNVPAKTQSAKAEIAQPAESPAPSVQPPRSVSPRPDSPPKTQTASVPSAQPPNAGSIINGWDSAPAVPRTIPTTTVGSFETRAPVFVPPKPLSQVMPNTRTLAPGTISQVTRVEVAVRIDNTGHVLSAHVLNENGNGKGALSAAALAAARQWTFQPATLQGEKVESEHTIVFEFRPENQ
jgi:TonB family protein